MAAKIIKYLVAQSTGPKVVVATSNYSGLHVLQIIALNDFSAKANVENQ